MTDDEILLSHARDLKRTAAEDGLCTHTAFLDLHQRTVLQALGHTFSGDVDTFFYGGFPDAERTVAMFIPHFFEAESAASFLTQLPQEQMLAVLRADKDHFHTLSHRDVLGSLMGLQIKRELLGDILVDDDGAYLICLSSVKRYLLENWNAAGRATLTVREAEVSELSAQEAHIREMFVSVASLRLDSVLGAAFSLSRSSAAAAVQSGTVFVNSVQALKPDQRLAAGDKLVLRGKGKVVLAALRGESKKGRIHLLLQKYE